MRVDLWDRDPCCPSGKTPSFSRWLTNTFLSTFSNDLMRWLVRATGLKLAGSALEPPLCSGQICTRRSSSGIIPMSKEALQNEVRGWLNSFLHSLSNRAGTPSGPGEELPFNSSKASSRSTLLNFKSDKLLTWFSSFWKNRLESGTVC